jgi:hypothetical protein
MSFLSNAFQSQSANNTTSIVSKENSTKLPLGGQNSFFLGQFVPSANYSVVQLSCLSDTLVEIVVESSFDGINYTVTEAFFNTQADIDATRAAPFYGFITLPYVRILITNIDTITNTNFEFCTKLTSTSPPANQIDPAPVIIIGTVQVQDLPLENIAGVLATRPVGSMTINDWYRVASPGDTSGAVWLEIGAYIVPGESAPRVGTLFQCIYVYGDSSPTAGKVWDVQYNTWEADNLVVTAGDLQVVEKNSADILTAVNSIDGKIVTCDTGAVVVASGNINIDNFPATQPISGTVEVSSIIESLPEGTNRIGGVNAYAYNLSLDNFTALTIESDNNLKVVEKNSADILTAVNSIDGKIIGCNTDAVIVASGSITETNSAAIAASVASIDGHIIGCNTDAVIVASGSITETNSAAIAASVASIDGHIIGCNTDAVIVASGSITETNSAAIAASVASIDGHIIGCNTDAVTISTSLPEGGATIGAVSLLAYNIFAGTNLSLLINDNQNLKVVEENSADILTAVNSIDSKIIACDTGAVVISSGTVTTQSSRNVTTQASVPTVPITAGVKFNSPSVSTDNYSLLQIALKASATSITSTMTFLVEYSPNNTDWFISTEVLAFTNGGPLNIISPGASFSAMPYVRLSYDPPALSTDTASNVVIYFLQKSVG